MASCEACLWPIHGPRVAHRLVKFPSFLRFWTIGPLAHGLRHSRPRRVASIHEPTPLLLNAEVYDSWRAQADVEILDALTRYSPRSGRLQTQALQKAWRLRVLSVDDQPKGFAIFKEQKPTDLQLKLTNKGWTSEMQR